MKIVILERNSVGTDVSVDCMGQFGQVAVKFFENRDNKKFKVDAAHADVENKVHPV